MSELPEYYFRVRDNGAFVFRINAENRQRRIEMDQIAVVNIRNGDIKPHGGHTLEPRELEQIRDWADKRSAQMSRRNIDDIYRTVDQLNRTAHWAQSRATEQQLDEVTDALLLAMHDLRDVLVRKKASRLNSGD